MENNWSMALKASISEVFSTMFFMVPEWDPELLPGLSAQKTDGWLEGKVEVAKPGARVNFWVWCPPRLAQELAANILAAEPADLDAEQVSDAYREMLNMVVGGVLTAVDPQGAWRMGLPQARVRPHGTVREMLSQSREHMAFDVEEKPLLAGVSQLQG